MLKSKLLWFIIILAAAGYFIIPRFLGGGSPAAMMAGGPMPAMVAPVVKKDITLWDEFSGRLTAVDNVQIRPRVSGMVDSVHFTDGEHVIKGALLFIIDPRPYKAALQAAQARYNQAKAEFDRAEPLLAEEAISQRDFDQRKSALTTTRAELTQARLNLSYTKVTAPISGKVGRREVTPGNLVNIGEPMLTTIVSQDPIYADFEADEQRLRKYLAANGNTQEALTNIPVKLSIPSIEERSGTIQSFDNQVDMRSGTIRVRAQFDNADGTLVPGMFASIRVTSGDSGPALLVTDSAIGTDQSKKFVYVLGEDNKTAYREVTIGAAHSRLRVVESGLKEGETIIIKGIVRIKPGMEVVPNKTTMEKAVMPQAEPATDEKPTEEKAP